MDIDAEMRAAALENPSHCPCRGRGWMLSDFDTWHRCPIHEGLPNPDPEYLDEAETEAQAVAEAAMRLRNYRKAYAWFRGQTLGLTREQFHQAVVAVLGDRAKSPATWTDAAEEVYEASRSESLDARARALGYSCRLKAVWAGAMD